MMNRINDGKNGYLYCDVNDNPDEYTDIYESAEECLQDILPNVCEECQKRGYTPEETETVKNHYSITFSNYAGEWKQIK